MALSASTGRPPSSYCAVNRNATFSPHVDSGVGAGQSRSLIVGLGDFTGGELCVEGVMHPVRYAPFEFDGWKERHWTLPNPNPDLTLIGRNDTGRCRSKGNATASSFSPLPRLGVRGRRRRHAPGENFLVTRWSLTPTSYGKESRLKLEQEARGIAKEHAVAYREASNDANVLVEIFRDLVYAGPPKA